jgi:hypothetical protein
MQVVLECCSYKWKVQYEKMAIIKFHTVTALSQFLGKGQGMKQTYLHVAVHVVSFIASSIV